MACYLLLVLDIRWVVFKIFDIVFSGLFFDKHLKYIKLSEDFVSFTKMNLTYLQKVSLYFLNDTFSL